MRADCPRCYRRNVFEFRWRITRNGTWNLNRWCRDCDVDVGVVSQNRENLAVAPEKPKLAVQKTLFG